MSLLFTGKRVLVTGGNGFLGSRIVSILQKKGVSDLIIPDSKLDDLRLKENCSKVTKNIDIVFHTAAKVGGIGLNQEKPGELFYDNLMMGVNLLEESRKNNVEKFISLGTICSYPKFTPLPFKEDDIWSGYPEETNAPYGLAKKMLLVQSNAYKEQYGFRSITVFPTNLYGPGDNFDDSSSHVIPALIKKINNAIKSNQDSIVLWGDGTPTRDFLFVDDAAKGIVLAAEKYEKTEPLNLGSGEEISIHDLAQLIMKIMGVNLKIKWDTTKPNGQPRRCISSERAKNEIGFVAETSLELGLKQTIEWYLN
ncbi:GDP-L-fucose synthase protein [Marine Group I thaumarchaeote SCGC AAA799-E16]|uniref:GDP-L-fucose synthase n=2 Tax=Marine Group I TaxID=905826 RepID=A0A087S243_9ARCH|nr:GDP-L-fucose synthase protein [Marine Group I thaumarchaeote SCGC AAA799-E16]KFM19797.1 GDP-L-fucose synthase protein [Marine Group I thaumarchaeote SCGC RSA3]